MIGGLVGLVLYLNDKEKGNQTGPTPGGSTPGGPVLYLLPEVNGFNAEDIELTENGYLVDPAVVKRLFPGGLGVIANNASSLPLETQYKG